MTPSRPLRVLLVNQYFPPDTSATARIVHDVVEALAKAGHHVTVVAGRPSYAPSETIPWRLLHREKRGSVIVERVGSSSFDRRAMAGRVSNYVTYLVLALGRGLVTPTDLVLAMTDPPLSPVVGALAAMVHRVPLVINVRDLHPDMAIAAGLVRRSVVTSVWERINRWALRRAALVLVLGEDMRRRIAAKGVRADRIVVVRDGAEWLPPPRANESVSRELRSMSPFVVMHAGNIGFAGAWETLLIAAAQCRGNGVSFVFVGDGAEVDQIKREAERNNNVKLFPSRPPQDVPALLAAGDLQIVTLRRGLEGLVMPSKLYPVLMAGRPVLAVVPEASDVAAIVRESRCGWVVSPDDPAAVTAAIREAVAAGPLLAEYGARARAAGQHFDRRRLMLDLVRKVEEAAVR